MLKHDMQFLAKTLRMAVGSKARGFEVDAIRSASNLSEAEFERFWRSRRIYLETSAFNHFVDTIERPDLELTRAYQRDKGVIFVTSPMLLWEIMLTADELRADKMLLAAQALFDPLLLATPAELCARYLRNAYPANTVNYSFLTNVEWASLWSEMTADFGKTFSFSRETLKAKTEPFRLISKNLAIVLDGHEHSDEMVQLATVYVREIQAVLSDDLNALGIDDVTAKLVILYVYLLLLLGTDLDKSDVDALWAEKGFTGDKAHAQVTEVFVDYPRIFACGPLLEMAVMVAAQYRAGSLNRGSLHDGMHMAYAPYVHSVLSNDHAFLRLANQHSAYKHRILHLSLVHIQDVELSLEDYPHDQRLRF